MDQNLCGWLLVLGGTAMVGLGGLGATLGWDKIRSEKQWRNAIIGVVREVELNERMIAEAMSLISRWPTRSEEENLSYQPYQDFHMVAMLTSGRLRPELPADSEVLTTLDTYRRAISQFNGALRVVGRLNPGIFIKVDLIHATDPKLWPKNTDDALAAPFRKMREAHKTAKRILEHQYPWAVSKEGPAGTWRPRD